MLDLAGYFHVLRQMYHLFSLSVEVSFEKANEKEVTHVQKNWASLGGMNTVISVLALTTKRQGKCTCGN